MLTLGSKAKYGNHDCIVVGRTIEAHSRYDLLFPSSHRVELNVPEEDLEPIFKKVKASSGTPDPADHLTRLGLDVVSGAHHCLPPGSARSRASQP